jgi:hypothetical protein
MAFEAAALGAPLPLAKARAVDTSLLPLPTLQGRETTQPLSLRLQTHDQAELLMVLDELSPGPEADRQTRAVADLLRAGQPDVVADHALDALIRLKSREARGVFSTFARHRRPAARLRAYTGLASLKDARDLPLLIGGLRDSDAGVRGTVAVLLGQLHATSAVPDLQRALELGVHPAAPAIGTLGNVASLEAYGKLLGRLPLTVMLSGYAAYLDRPDIAEDAKLSIVGALENVSGATVKAFLTQRIQTPSKHTTPKLQQAMVVSAGRIRVEADTTEADVTKGAASGALPQLPNRPVSPGKAVQP